MRRLSRAEAHAGACPASGSIAPKGVRAVRRRSLWIRKTLPPVLCKVSNGAFSTGNSFRFIIFASTISDLNRCPAKTICRTAGQPAIRRGGSRSRHARPPHRRTLHVGPFVRVCRFGLRPAPRHTSTSRSFTGRFSAIRRAVMRGRIHPDDLEQEAKNGVAGMRHVFLHRNPNMDVRPFELICEYRTLFWRIRDADRHYRQDSGSYEYEHDTTLCEDFRGEYQPRDASYL